VKPYNPLSSSFHSRFNKIGVLILGFRCPGSNEIVHNFIGYSGDEFTVEINHTGFFVGFGKLRSYVDGKVSWFDHCESHIWLTLLFDDFFEELGYEKSEDLKVYWLLPGKGLDDGLRVIILDLDTIAMCSMVDRVKNLVLYFDHANNVGGLYWDDVVANPTVSLPKFLSPVKAQPIKDREAEKLLDFYDDFNPATEVDCLVISSDEDSNLVDTDNKVVVGDADIAAHNEDEDDGYQCCCKIKVEKGCRQ
jgi:hypothetical protein